MPSHIPPTHHRVHWEGKTHKESHQRSNICLRNQRNTSENNADWIMTQAKQKRSCSPPLPSAKTTITRLKGFILNFTSDSLHYIQIQTCTRTWVWNRTNTQNTAHSLHAHTVQWDNAARSFDTDETSFTFNFFVD